MVVTRFAQQGQTQGGPRSPSSSLVAWPPSAPGRTARPGPRHWTRRPRENVPTSSGFSEIRRTQRAQGVPDRGAHHRRNFFTRDASAQRHRALERVACVGATRAVGKVLFDLEARRLIDVGASPSGHGAAGSSVHAPRCPPPSRGPRNHTCEARTGRPAARGEPATPRRPVDRRVAPLRSARDPCPPYRCSRLPDFVTT